MTDVEGKFNFSLTNEEIDFLLELLENKETAAEEQIEELTVFLKKQLKMIKDNRKKPKRKEKSLISKNIKQNETSLQSKDSDINKSAAMKKLLTTKLNENIIVNINLQGDCCIIKGILCNVGKDIVIMVEKNNKIVIKLEAIVSIQNKISSCPEPQFQNSNQDLCKLKTVQENDLSVVEQSKEIKDEQYKFSSTVKESLNSSNNASELGKEEIENEFVNHTVDEKENLKVKKSESTYTELEEARN